MLLKTKLAPTLVALCTLALHVSLCSASDTSSDDELRDSRPSITYSFRDDQYGSRASPVVNPDRRFRFPPGRADSFRGSEVSSFNSNPPPRSHSRSRPFNPAGSFREGQRDLFYDTRRNVGIERTTAVPSPNRRLTRIGRLSSAMRLEQNLDSSTDGIHRSVPQPHPETMDQSPPSFRPNEASHTAPTSTLHVVSSPSHKANPSEVGDSAAPSYGKVRYSERDGEAMVDEGPLSYAVRTDGYVTRKEAARFSLNAKNFPRYGNNVKLEPMPEPDEVAVGSSAPRMSGHTIDHGQPVSMSLTSGMLSRNLYQDEDFLEKGVEKAKDLARGIGRLGH